LSELAPPKCRIELFSEAAFFTDHFQKNVNLVGATATYDGDQVQVNVNVGDPFGQGQLYCDMPGVSINSNPNRYLVVRVTEFTPVSPGDHYWIGVTKLGSGSVGEQHTTIGLKILDLKTLNGGVDFDFTAFCLDFIGDHSTVTLDYVAIVKAVDLLPFPIEEDLADRLEITTPLLNNAVNGAFFSVPNFGGAYNTLIKEHDIVLIWLSRDVDDLGDPLYKRFGGRVVAPTKISRAYGDHFIDVECHGFAAELNIPPALLQEIYAAVNGRTIVEAAVALAAYVVKHPTAAKWFDNTGSSGSTDDRINSTHDVSYDEVKPLVSIQEIIEKALNPASVQGFDMYEMPSGVLVGHLRNSLDFVSPIAELTPEAYKYKRDAHRVRNKIKVYGAQTKKQPLDGDSYSEATTNWTSDGTLSADGSDKQVGSYSIKATVAAIIVYAQRSLDNIVTTDFRKGYKKLHVYAKCDNTVGNNSDLIISLCAPDYANSFFHVIPMINGVWQEITIPIGRNEKIWAVGGGGAPDWNNIQNIRFTLNSSGGSATVTLHIDNLFFSDARFDGSAEDEASQATYGVRVPDPVVDEALQSDAECEARAESLVAQQKDPILTLENVLTDGDHRLWPGDRQHTHGSNDGIDETFRIVEVKDVVKKCQWDAVLALSNEPQLHDSVFRMLLDKIVLLEKR